MSSDRSSDQPVASVLGDWVADLTYEELPPEIVELAKLCIRDAVACAVLGARRPRMKAFEAAILPEQQGGRASVFLGSRKASVGDAVFINALYAHSSELDDAFLGAGGHPSAVTVPVALATAETTPGVSGRDVITAVVAGYDVFHRATAPIHPKFTLRGFQGTGVGGSFVATATVAKLRHTPGETVAQALAIAGCTCSGLSEYDQSGGETKRLYAGQAARAGVQAVAMAEAGLDGPLTIFEGPRGVYHGFGYEGWYKPERALSGLGSEFRIARRRVKPYPGVANIAAPVDAAAALREQAPNLDEIERILVQVQPEAAVHGGSIDIPWNLVSAQFSIGFSVALRLATGRNDIDQYESEAVRTDPTIVELCKKVVISAIPQDDANATATAIVTLEFRDGSSTTHIQQWPSGSPENPLTDQQMEDRFFRFTNGHLNEAAQKSLNEQLTRLEELDSLDEVINLLR